MAACRAVLFFFVLAALFAGMRAGQGAGPFLPGHGGRPAPGQQRRSLPDFSAVNVPSGVSGSAARLVFAGRCGTGSVPAAGADLIARAAAGAAIVFSSSFLISVQDSKGVRSVEAGLKILWLFYCSYQGGGECMLCSRFFSGAKRNMLKLSLSEFGYPTKI